VTGALLVGQGDAQSAADITELLEQVAVLSELGACLGQFLVCGVTGLGDGAVVLFELNTAALQGASAALCRARFGGCPATAQDTEAGDHGEGGGSERQAKDSASGCW
jgi:hypothetical protein